MDNELVCDVCYKKRYNGFKYCKSCKCANETCGNMRKTNGFYDYIGFFDGCGDCNCGMNGCGNIRLLDKFNCEKHDKL